MRLLILALAVAVAPGAACAQQKSSTIQPRPSAAGLRGHDERLRAGWEKALVRLQKADDESIAAVNETMAEVGSGFDAAAKKVRPFVVESIDLWGQARYVKGLVGKASDLGASLTNYVFGTEYEAPVDPNGFEKHVRASFAAQVFDPDDVKRLIQGGVESYAAKLEAIEARLLVDLRADVEAPRLAIPEAATPRLDEELFKQLDAGASLCVAQVASEFGYTVAKELVASWGGGIISGVVLPASHAGAGMFAFCYDPYSFALATTGWALNYGVGVAIDKAVEKAGRDPAGALAGRLEALLRRTQAAVYEGEDAAQSSKYVWFTIFREAFAEDPDGRSFAFAAESVRTSHHLGLRPTLTALHGERLCARRRLAYVSIFGRPAPPEACLSPAQIKEKGRLLEEARGIEDAAKSRLFKILLAD